MPKFTGICCGCNSTVGIHYSHQDQMWLTDNHDFPGMNEHCLGSCQNPQVVFKDGKQLPEEGCLEGSEGDA